MEPIDKFVLFLFLEPLTNAIVSKQAQAHYSAEGPFPEVLAEFLERYPSDATIFLLLDLHLPRHVRAYRSIPSQH